MGALVPQDDTLLPGLTVRQTLAFGAALRLKAPPAARARRSHLLAHGGVGAPGRPRRAVGVLTKGSWISVNQFKFFSKQHRFFNFHNSENDINNKLYIDLTSDKDYYISNMHDIFKNQLSKKISFYGSTELDNETLVIHIRNGDIFSGKSKYKQYVQNPLVYYEKLIANYKKVIVVTESYGNNPVIEKLKDYSNVKIQSLSLEEDFRTLLSAKNLATSGVGTFGIAAALMSKNLKRLYCSDIFLSHHLNPYMLDPNYVKVHIYNIKNYIDIGQWNFDNKVSKIMMSKNIKIEGPKIMSHDEKNN